jgi:hypothetical protein
MCQHPHLHNDTVDLEKENAYCLFQENENKIQINGIFFLNC